MLDPAKFSRLDLDAQDRILGGLHRMTEADRQRRNVRMAWAIAIAFAVLGAGMVACLVSIVT